jgi:hypothetical protein
MVGNFSIPDHFITKVGFLQLLKSSGILGRFPVQKHLFSALQKAKSYEYS